MDLIEGVCMSYIRLVCVEMKITTSYHHPRTHTVLTTFHDHHHIILTIYPNPHEILIPMQAFGTGSDDSTCRFFDIRSCGEVSEFKNDMVRTPFLP